MVNGICSDSDIRLGSLAPERVQNVDTCHLIRTVVQTLKADLAQVGADESSQVVGPLTNRFLDWFGRVLEEKEIYIVAGFVPLPNADHLAVANDGGQRIVDEL